MSRNKRIGTEFETAVADYLNEALGQYVEGWRDADCRWRDPRDPNNIRRNVQTGARDISDLSMWPFAGECKNEKAITLSEYIRQANREALNAGADYGVAIVKARGQGVARSYAVMDLETFARVLQRLRQQ